MSNLRSDVKHSVLNTSARVPRANPWKGIGRQQWRLLKLWQAVTDVNCSFPRVFDSCPCAHTVCDLHPSVFSFEYPNSHSLTVMYTHTYSVPGFCFCSNSTKWISYRCLLRTGPWVFNVALSCLPLGRGWPALLVVCSLCLSMCMTVWWISPICCQKEEPLVCWM